MVEDAFVNVTNKFNGAVTIGRNARVRSSKNLISKIENFSSLKELLRNGAIVQLVSKHSGHLLQLVMGADSTLTFDGNGLVSSFNSKFPTNFHLEKTCIFEQNYIVITRLFLLMFSLFHC